MSEQLKASLARILLSRQDKHLMLMGIKEE